MLKRFLPIALLSFYILFNSPCREFAKLPLLIHHYLEHKTTESELSFTEFLSIHYMKPFVQDEDYKKDMSLPLKSENQSIFFFTFSFNAIEIFSFKTLQFPSEEVKILNWYKNKLYASQYLDAIFQPPQLM